MLYIIKKNRFNIILRKYIFVIKIILIASCNSKKEKTVKSIDTVTTTICNPLNLNYRFAIDGPSRREAADPTVVLYKGEYYLFASKSGGYWSSKDLIKWNFIKSSQLPFEDYAPTAIVIKDTLYFVASNNKSPITIYKTTNPKSGEWEVANPNFPFEMTDPALFYDNNRLYLYYGCSNKDPLYGLELDVETLQPISEPIPLLNSKKEDYGWERWGNYNDGDKSPWIEGAWVNKYNGKYYLQYAGPGTRFKSYNDGVYLSDQPLGPYTLAKHNPMAYKPEGFINGAGHGNTFKDKYGNYWHFGTMVLTLKHKFERRIGMYPAFFDKDNVLYTYTGFGDYPYRIPQEKIESPEDLFKNWMLLSYQKTIRASSQLENYPKKNAVDEEIRTYWSAETGSKGEWFEIDLGKISNIHAIQINFAEHQTQIHGRTPEIYHQYLLEYSVNGNDWEILIDKTQNKKDFPHDFIELKTPIKARKIKITNYKVPDGTFALYDLRVFGNASGNKPTENPKLEAFRGLEDRTMVTLKWTKIEDAHGYNIRYGTHPQKLYHNYQVLNKEDLIIRTLNKFQPYYFSIDSFNENGVLLGKGIIEVK